MFPLWKFRPHFIRRFFLFFHHRATTRWPQLKWLKFAPSLILSQIFLGIISNKSNLPFSQMVNLSSNNSPYLLKQGSFENTKRSLALPTKYMCNSNCVWCNWWLADHIEFWKFSLNIHIEHFLKPLWPNYPSSSHPPHQPLPTINSWSKSKGQSSWVWFIITWTDLLL